MALTGKMVNPHRVDAKIEDAYAKIAWFRDNCKDTHLFGVDIYYSEDDRRAKSPAKPIRQDVYTVTKEQYQRFFSEDVLKGADVSIRSQEYAYLKTLPEFSSWVGDS